MTLQFTHSCLAVLIFGLSFITAQTLEDSLSGIVALFPNDNGYREAANAFNRRFNLSPAGVTYPASTAEVSEIVKVGAQFGLPVAARSGGHNYIANGLGGKDGALVLDLSNLTALAYDDTTGQAVIGPGNRLGTVIPFLNDHGRGMPHGSCKYVGIGGHAAFGGFGSASRMWGLNLDAVVAAEVVLANGTIATVSETSYPDLFWAIRGSGSSFGIITAITFQTHPVPESALIFGYEWVLSSTEATTSFLTMQSHLETIEYPSTMYQQVAFRPADQKGMVKVKLSGAWFGEKSKLNETIAPFLAGLPTPGSQYSGGGSWLECMAFPSGGNLDVSAPDGIDNFYAKSLFTKEGHPVTKKAAEAFINYLSNEGVGSSASWFVQFDLYGGSNSAVNAVPLDATSFAHRDVFFNVQLYGTSGQQPFPSDGFALVDGMVDAIVSNSPPNWPYSTYMNYVDDRLDNWQRLYYGRHYKRLQSLKKRYDPNNVFRFPTSIELP